MLLLLLVQVTLNLCLSSGHSGGELYLLGSGGRGDLTVQHRCPPLMISPFCSPPLNISLLLLLPLFPSVPCRQGWGLLHRGAALHGALPILEGERTNLIIWLR